MKILLAGCVLVDDYGRILLLHRNTDRYSHWELPGGKIEEGETAEQAAVREIHEELGVEVQLTKSLGSGEFEDNEHEYSYAWFQAVITKGNPEVKEPQTFDDLDYVEIENLMSLALSANMLVLEDAIFSGEVILDT